MQITIHVKDSALSFHVYRWESDREYKKDSGHELFYLENPWGQIVMVVEHGKNERWLNVSNDAGQHPDCPYVFGQDVECYELRP